MSIATLKAASKQTVRHPTAKVTIAWSNTSTETNTVVSTLGIPVNRAAIPDQIADGRGVPKVWAHCMTNNAILPSTPRLDAMYAMPNVQEGQPPDTKGYLVGWWGDGQKIGNRYGQFGDPLPAISLEMHPPIPVSRFRIRGYNQIEYPVDFDVQFYSGTTNIVEEIRGNTSVDLDHRLSMGEIKDVSRIDLLIRRWSERYTFVKLEAFVIDLENFYTTDDIVSLSLLEETDGAFGTLPVGNISANELTLTLQNLDDTYFFGNTASKLSNSLRANRRIEPYLGFDDEMIPKGVFWSREWTVADQGTTASTTASDRLGLLQDVQYNGLGNINNPDADAELTVWQNKSLYAVVTDVLTDLRNTYMTDLEFQVDDILKSVIVPVAFFKTVSYFDVLRTVAQAACAFAYMDTPTDEEIDAAAARGNYTCADILRIRPLEQFFTTALDGAQVDPISRDDFIDKNTSARRSDVVNLVTVSYAEYTIGADGKPQEVKDENAPPKVFTAQSESSILEYGKLKFDYNDNHLIQTRSHAQNIATRILSAFSGTPHIAEIQMFGDVTRKIGDILEVPEYQKNGIDTRGYYAVTRIGTDFDGGLRQSVTCRKLKDAEPPLGEIDVEFTANPLKVAPGGSSTLYWTVSG